MSRFDYFIVFAEMRTGSNFLEENLNAFADLSCHGEAFNPHFIGYPNRDSLLGLDRASRDRKPADLLARVKAEPGLAGFRFFHDHDPRVLDLCLPDPRCAKIVLTRNPAESYVSWKIARETGQWKLTNPSHAKSMTVDFDAAEFEAHLEALQEFQVMLMNRLQKSGQTAFYIAYEDLQDLEVMNGLAQWLGAEDRIKALSKKLKKQNPTAMGDKVANFPQMEGALARLDRFNLSRTPNFEPRRGPMVPSYVAAPESGLLYLPLKSGPTPRVERWLAALDGRQPDALLRRFTQKTLRDWQAAHPGARSFTVLRHPVAWAHAAFCDRILGTGEGSYPEMRASLAKLHGIVLPEDPADPGYDDAAHKAAFAGFLRFLRMNLSAQTAARVDPAWGTQLSVLQGMAEFGLPDMILREETLRRDLAMLARQVGRDRMPDIGTETDPHAARLAAIYDAGIEAAARDAYGRDYLAFGFGDWRAG